MVMEPPQLVQSPPAVVFDLDGILANTEDLYDQAGEEVLRRRGKTYDADLRERVMGRPVVDAIKIMIESHSLTDTVDGLMAECGEMLARLIDSSLAPMPSAIALIDNLQSANIPIAVATSATAEYADWLLPSTDMFERADINITGLGLQHQPWVQWTDPVVAPRGERREEWWIFGKLAQAASEARSEPQASEVDSLTPPAHLWSRTDHMLRGRGLTLDALRKLPHGAVFEDGLDAGSFFDEHLQTPDKKIDCCPPAFEGALLRAEAIFVEEAAAGTSQLKLITRRDPFMHNSWYANLPVMKRGARDRNRLAVHPDDLRARGLAAGAKVRLWNEHGAVEVEVESDDGLVPGVVALTHGWGNERTPGMRVAQRTPGVNANALLPTGPGSFEPLSNQAFMTGVPVSMIALAAGRQRAEHG